MFETLNHFGWKILGILCIVELVFTVLCYTSPWWVIDFLHHCQGKDEVHLVVYVQYGVCGVDTTGGISRNDCISWNEEHEWEEIDNDGRSQTNTQKDANFVYPIANVMTIIILIVSVLQIALCFLYLKFKKYARLGQYFMFVFSVMYAVLGFWVGMMGGRSDVVRESTWSPFTKCKDGYSYPFTAYYSLCISCVTACAIGILTVMPAYFYCFHLLDYDIDDKREEIMSEKQSRETVSISGIADSSQVKYEVYPDFSSEKSSQENRREVGYSSDTGSRTNFSIDSGGNNVDDNMC